MTFFFVCFNRRGWAFLRSRSADKENLMANMGLPCDHESDSEVKAIKSVRTIKFELKFDLLQFN